MVGQRSRVFLGEREWNRERNGVFLFEVAAGRILTWIFNRGGSEVVPAGNFFGCELLKGEVVGGGAGFFPKRPSFRIISRRLEFYC